MTHRTTFALDAATADRLRRLASLWRISQAEVVRRAVAQIDKTALSGNPDPATLLRAYHDKGGIDAATADAMIAEVEQNRNTWRGEP